MDDTSQHVHLAHHNVRRGPAPGLTSTPERLDAQILHLKTTGYTFLTCGELVRRYRRGLLADRVATLSFDDGLADHRRVGRILKKHGIPGTFFCMTAPLDGFVPPVMGLQILISRVGAEFLEKVSLPRYLKGTKYAEMLKPEGYDMTGKKVGEPEEMRLIKQIWNHEVETSLQRELMPKMFHDLLGTGMESQYANNWFLSASDIRRLYASGMEIGSHTVSHPWLPLLSLDEAQRELIESHERLSAVINEEVETFCWTFGGDMSPDLQGLALGLYDSAWNLCKDPKALESGYTNLADIARLSEKVFELPAARR